jgi:beta-glucosidase
MNTQRRRTGIILGSIIALSAAVTSSVASTANSADRSIETQVNALVGRMTLDEKLQQLQLLSDGQVTADDARKGVGGVFSLVDPAKINALQHVAVEQSRLHIPILFAYDTIHGYRTVFPIPLGAASSFDPQVVAADDRIGARESAAVGIKQIYSPMVDVSHEPRWGRISEAGGEDPYLNSVLAAARVKAAQGGDYSAPDKVVTSVKHYAAYGQPEGGREYNTTDMSQQRLRNLYLPPFKAAVEAGADTAMCSFNAINGVPGCGDPYTETSILKNEWGFDGFIESDYTAVAELRACPPTARMPRPWRSTPAPTPRWSAPISATTASNSLPTARSRSSGSTTRCAGFCGSSSVRGCLNTPTSTFPRRSRRNCARTPWRPRGRRQTARWCC